MRLPPIRWFVAGTICVGSWSCSTDTSTATVAADNASPSSSETKNDGSGGKVDTTPPVPTHQRPSAAAVVAGGGLTKSANYKMLVTVGGTAKPGIASQNSRMNLGLTGAMEGK